MAELAPMNGSWHVRCPVCNRISIPIRNEREEAYIRWLETANQVEPWIFIINCEEEFEGVARHDGKKKVHLPTMKWRNR